MKRLPVRFGSSVCVNVGGATGLVAFVTSRIGIVACSRAPRGLGVIRFRLL